MVKQGKPYKVTLQFIPVLGVILQLRGLQHSLVPFIITPKSNMQQGNKAN